MSQKPSLLDLPTPYYNESDRRERVLDACSQLEPIFRRQVERRHIPGIAYGVMVDGELIFTHSFGVRDVATESPVDADSVFRIASMTKSFTALAVLQLRDAGQLCLDEPAATYVPELAHWRYPTADAPLITVRHLLTMTAGLPQDDPWADRQLYRTDAAMSEFYQAGVAWSNPPGITFEYSNYGYMVLGRIITNVAGIPAVTYINEQVLKPLAMTATVWNAADVDTDRLALGYRWEDERWKAEPLLPSGGDVAAFAGLLTSVRDLARWVALFQSAWPARNEPEQTPLCRSSLREMQQIASAYAPTINNTLLGMLPEVMAGGYGYGLSVLHNGHWESVGHGGGLPGFGSHMRWAPAYGVGIVALANITYANVSAACIKGLEILISRSQVKPRMQPIAPDLAAARAAVLRLVQQWDDDLAVTLFADNFFLDMDLTHWVQMLKQLVEKHGLLTPEGPFVVENWLRGAWRMVGERGWCQLSITLSPTTPPRIQEWEITSTLPPSPSLQRAATRLAALIAHPVRREVARLCSAEADQVALWDQVRLANILCGPCVVGKVTGGDGVCWNEFQFIGNKGNLSVKITVNERGKVRDAILRPGSSSA